MPLVAFAALAVPQLGAAEIRDRAGIFTAEAIKKAETVSIGSSDEQKSRL